MSAEDDRELSDLLPWLANGTLAGDEREAVEGFVARSTEAQAELRLWKAVQDEVEREPVALGVDLGWRRLEKQLQQSKAPVSPMWNWKIAAAVAALGIVGLQATILLRMESERDAGLTQLGAPTAVISKNEWLVQVRFSETATVTQINNLLLQLDARIVNGPSALGVYQVAVTRSDRFTDSAAVVDWLSAQPIVEQGALPP